MLKTEATQETKPMQTVRGLIFYQTIAVILKLKYYFVLELCDGLSVDIIYNFTMFFACFYRLVS